MPLFKSKTVRAGTVRAHWDAARWDRPLLIASRVWTISPLVLRWQLKWLDRYGMRRDAVQQALSAVKWRGAVKLTLGTVPPALFIVFGYPFSWALYTRHVESPSSAPPSLTAPVANAKAAAGYAAGSCNA